MLYSIAALAILLLLSAFFSGTETAFTSISTTQIEALKARHPGRGKRIAALNERPDILLTTILIGNNIANIGASVLAADITTRVFGRGALSISTGLLTFFVLVFGEVTPKQLAILNNEFWVLHTCNIVNALTWLFRPLVFIVGGISRTISRLGGGSSSRAITLENILQTVRHGEMAGVIESFKGRMVKSLFRFDDVPVSAILTHRTHVISVEKQSLISSVFATCLEHGYSRLPVYDKDPERIVGVVLFRDASTAWSHGKQETAVKTIMREPVFVSENRNVQDVFHTLKKESLNMVIVLDEYGGLAGIVTMEDVVEELLGELYDENEQKLGEKIIALNKEGIPEYKVFADIPIYQFNEYFNTAIDENNDSQTIGGYLTELIGHIPAPHQLIETPSGRFIIDRMARKHIISVRFQATIDQTPSLG